MLLVVTMDVPHAQERVNYLHQLGQAVHGEIGLHQQYIVSHAVSILMSTFFCTNASIKAP